MDWITIISIIASALSGGILTYFINPRAAWKKPEIDNKAAEAQTESTAITTMKDAISEIRISNDHFQTVNEQREKTIENLRKQLTDCQSDLSISNSYICARLGCANRLPCRGAGNQWIAKLKTGDVSPDFTPMRCSPIQTSKDFEPDIEN